ncbi:MAG: CHAP domain-containing protein [Clostridia bacterium]|nr:CHAP domain-containing protein [Clostridia bacterium]
MKRLIRLTALCLVLCSLASSAFAAAATPTPPPLPLEQEVLDPPTIIQNVLDIAYTEWLDLNGQPLKKVNKFTEWRGKGVSFGWCGGYITWCMLEAGVPMEELEYFRKNSDKKDHLDVEGIFHVKEASVGKLLRGYQIMNRTTHVPQKGYMLVYGCSYNKTIHVALVSDVEILGDGKFRITTLEGNMSNRVKMYVHDYDMYASDWESNLSEVPADQRTQMEDDSFDYTLPVAKPSASAKKKSPYYVNCFLMTWVPDDELNELTTPTPPPAK